MPITTRSGRLVKPVPRLVNLMMSELVSTTKKPMNVEWELLIFATMYHAPEEVGNPLLAYKAVNPDILRLHEAMQAKDQKKFKAAIEKEVYDQIDNGNFPVIPQSQVPTRFRVFPRVWTLVRKRDILTREIKKYIKLVLLLRAPGCDKENIMIKPMPRWRRGCQSAFF